ncbi:cytochrome b [Maricurvus nonylphenolicus]|uniref:cytochrome b n=1 Tax=Maricurvus nonylphenolicus TaxID=1008307 RepID=UPI0036F2F4C1
MKDSYQYGGFDRFIHWLMALNILATLIFSKGMSQLPGDLKIIEYGDHGMSVTTILICLVIRTIWRASKGFPSLPEAMSAVQVLAAKAVHYLLYIAMFAQIVIGILLASTTSQDFVAANYGINYSSFNLIDDSYYELLVSLHIAGYWLIIGLLVVHIVAALKHHWIDKDQVLRNMLPFVKRNQV